MPQSAISADTHNIIAMPSGDTIALPKTMPIDDQNEIAAHVHALTSTPVEVSSEPESADTDTAEADAAPDMPALAGTTNPSIADALGTTQPVMPRMATGRDYLDNPTSLEGLSKLYQAAGASLTMPPQPGDGPRPEKLIPIDQTGRFGQTSTGGSRDQDGAMHATASIPTDSQAIIHTHPRGQNPQPSADDYVTATKIGKPNFVMSRDAIYVAMPGGDVGHPVKVADISQGKGGKLNIKWK